MAAEADLTVIVPTGDLILDVQQEAGTDQFSYRVDSTTLRQNSRYFENLLSTRFNEGARVASEHDELKKSGKYSSLGEALADALPRISISNIGRISISKDSMIKNLAADFLRVLHAVELATSPPVANLANLAVVADRFDALEHFCKHVQRKKYIQAIDSKTKVKPGTSLPEERARQRLLIGLLFDHPPWVTKYSKQLIIGDSVKWKPEAEEDHEAALWWDVPGGIEDEMIQRREYVLETINSLQSHFLKLYTSGERQCKLGYDSSLQCDSYQLGEMIRFFSRLGTLRLQGTIYDDEPPPHYSGDIDRLLESFRACPSYQIDRNHAHCGLRTRLIPQLDLVQNIIRLDASSLDVGICLQCWNENRTEYAWSQAKRPVLWMTQRLALYRRNAISSADFTGRRIERRMSSCLNRHLAVRDMFTAVERDWSAI